MINEQGFTLIEMMFAMAISATVAMAAFALFASMNWSQQVQEGVGEAQQNVRVTISRLTKDLRRVGIGTPDPPFSLGYDTTDNGSDDTHYTTAITIASSGGAAAADSVTLLGLGHKAAILKGIVNVEGESSICVDSFANFSGISPNTLRNRRHLSIGGSSYKELTSWGGGSCPAGSDQLNLRSPLDKSYPDGTPLYIIQAVTYNISTVAPCSAADPCLKSDDITSLRGRGAQVVSENIEDLQFAYGVDSLPKNSIVDSYVNDTINTSDIIAVRVSIVARTRNMDPRNRSMKRPAMEDRAEGGVTDGFRRRVLTKVVTMRNY